MWISHSLSALLLGLSVRRFLHPAPECPTSLVIDRELHLPSLVAVVTGSTGGIGLETVKQLVDMGVGTVYLTGRNQTALDRLTQLSICCIRTAMLDLNSLDSVRSFAKEFQAKHDKLDILILNGGVIAAPYEATADGFEVHIGTNYLSHFLLVQLLLPQLVAAGHSSVIHVSSRSAHSGSFSPLHWKYAPCVSGACKTSFAYYEDSKYLQIMFSIELHRRYYKQGVVSTAVHPGIVLTNAGRFIVPEGYEWLVPAARDALSGLVFHHVSDAVATQLYAIFHPEANRIGGRFLSDCSPRPWQNFDYVDEDLGRRIWAESMDAVGLTTSSAQIPSENVAQSIAGEGDEEHLSDHEEDSKYSEKVTRAEVLHANNKVAESSEGAGATSSNAGSVGQEHGAEYENNRIESAIAKEDVLNAPDGGETKPNEEADDDDEAKQQRDYLDGKNEKDKLSSTENVEGVPGVVSDSPLSSLPVWGSDESNVLVTIELDASIKITVEAASADNASTITVVETSVGERLANDNVTSATIAPGIVTLRSPIPSPTKKQAPPLKKDAEQNVTMLPISHDVIEKSNDTLASSSSSSASIPLNQSSTDEPSSPVSESISHKDDHDTSSPATHPIPINNNNNTNNNNTPVEFVEAEKSRARNKKKWNKAKTVTYTPASRCPSDPPEAFSASATAELVEEPILDRPIIPLSEESESVDL